MRIALTLIGLLLGGCASSIGTAPPPGRCMLPPKPLDEVKPGDDITQKYATLRHDKATDDSKLRCTQAYVRATLGK